MKERTMTERDMQSKMTDAQLDMLFRSLAEGIEQLHDLSEIGDGGRARTLFYALAVYLDERDIIDELKAAAMYAADHQADLGPGGLLKEGTNK
jgi:hypothetical protein